MPFYLTPNQDGFNQELQNLRLCLLRLSQPLAKQPRKLL